MKGGGEVSNNFLFFFIIGYFRVLKTLTLKTRPNAKPLDLDERLTSRLFIPDFCTKVLLKKLFFAFHFVYFFFILGSCGYSYASKAFIFSLYNAKGYNPVKLTQYQHQQNAMYRCNTYGPTFGSHDIHISNDAINSHTNCGTVYSIPSGYSYGNCGFFTGGLHFTPTDIEVFYEITN